MSGSYASRLRTGGGTGVGAGGGRLGTTTVLAAKVVFASAAVAAAASLARLAVPQLVVSVAAGADAFLWKLYLFVAVHVIIFVIWKLSDHKHFHASQNHKDPWAPTPVDEDGGVKRKEEFVSAADALQAGVARRKDSWAAPAARRPPPPPVAAEVVPGFIPKEEFFSGYGVPPLQKKFSPKEEAVSPDSGVGESCVTTECEEDDSSSAADEWRSMAPAPLQRAVLERDLSLPLPPPAIAATAMDCFDTDDAADDDDDLEATWNAIMQKTRPSTAPASSTPPAPQAPTPAAAPAVTVAARPRAREPSVGAAELSKRADDFIKKIHHSFGRQQ